jgi:hypothetical protein
MSALHDTRTRKYNRRSYFLEGMTFNGWRKRKLKAERDPQSLQAIASIIAAYAALFGGIWAVMTRPIENRLADVIDRLKHIEEKLDRIDEKLDGHSERITRLEERRLK